MPVWLLLIMSETEEKGRSRLFAFGSVFAATTTALFFCSLPSETYLTEIKRWCWLLLLLLFVGDNDNDEIDIGIVIFGSISFLVVNKEKIVSHFFDIIVSGKYTHGLTFLLLMEYISRICFLMLILFFVFGESLKSQVLFMSEWEEGWRITKGGKRECRGRKGAKLVFHVVPSFLFLQSAVFTLSLPYCCMCMMKQWGEKRKEGEKGKKSIKKWQNFWQLG